MCQPYNDYHIYLYGLRSQLSINYKNCFVERMYRSQVKVITVLGEEIHCTNFSKLNIRKTLKLSKNLIKHAMTVIQESIINESYCYRLVIHHY